jgi:hypothetical protein
MKFELENLPRNSSFDEIKKEILRVADLIKSDNITIKEFDRLSKISSSALRNRFGTWQNILLNCGLGSRYSGRTVSEKMIQQTKHLTDEEIINELHRVFKSLNKNSLTTTDINKYSKIISYSTVTNRFGSWNKGLEAANLTIAKKGRRYSELDYFENMIIVWTHYGRQPKYREMDFPPSIITSGAYETKWGKWSNALLAFVEYVNKDKTEEVVIEEDKFSSDKNELANKIENSSVRSIAVSLRYKVLTRDRFRCVKCGKSPATSLNCEIHVDHIIPFSKGGKTVFENLQTTCRDCNMGKSNNYYE